MLFRPHHNRSLRLYTEDDLEEVAQPETNAFLTPGAKNPESCPLAARTPCTGERKQTKSP
jgi:hypothetical protein